MIEDQNEYRNVRGRYEPRTPGLPEYDDLPVVAPPSVEDLEYLNPVDFESAGRDYEFTPVIDRSGPRNVDVPPDAPRRTGWAYWNRPGRVDL